MAFTRIVIAVSAIPFAVVGAAFLLFPAPMASLVGLSLLGATADADVRAVYGGLQLGCATFLALCAANAGWWRAGLAAQLLLYGGLAGARMVSCGVAGLPSPLGWALHAGELIGFGLGVVAWRRLPHRADRAAS